jgi:hypothetical protein
MTKFFADYFWKEGLPYGITPVLDMDHIAYKIVMDPYRSWVSIEKYSQGKFREVVYDSQRLNFRKLKPESQTAWMKTLVEEGESGSSYLILDQNDRVIYIETYTFEGHLCRSCKTFSPQKLPLALTRMYYKHLGDPFNGIILFDLENHPVMYKMYEVDLKTNEFTTLIQESWDMSDLSTKTNS